MKRYLYLTDDCSFCVKEVIGSSVILTWHSNIDLSCFKLVGLLQIQIGPLLPSNSDYVIRVYSNLVTRSIFNPNRELAFVQIARGDMHLGNQSFTGVVLVQTMSNKF